MDVISSDWESLLRLAVKGKVAYLDRVVGCWNLHENNASLSNCWRDLVKNLEIWDSIYQTASALEIPPEALQRARTANLLSIARRDVSQAFTGGAIFGAFRYLYHGFPILKSTVVLRVLIHPYIWAKCGVNIYRQLRPGSFH
jgi:hypothetical protein